MKKCLILDIDGVLVEQKQNFYQRLVEKGQSNILPGVIDKLLECDTKGHHIIIITARRESSRVQTEKELSDLGIFYDALVMGVGTGPRILVNDLKPGSDQPTAIAFNVKRNEGIGNIEI